eukprot:8826151-Pyramimonas_sp.AAC.1
MVAVRHKCETGLMFRALANLLMSRRVDEAIQIANSFNTPDGGVARIPLEEAEGDRDHAEAANYFAACAEDEVAQGSN